MKISCCSGTDHDLGLRSVCWYYCIYCTRHLHVLIIPKHASNSKILLGCFLYCNLLSVWVRFVQYWQIKLLKRYQWEESFFFLLLIFKYLLIINILLQCMNMKLYFLSIYKWVLSSSLTNQWEAFTNVYRIYILLHSWDCIVIKFYIYRSSNTAIVKNDGQIDRRKLAKL